MNAIKYVSFFQTIAQAVQLNLYLTCQETVYTDCYALIRSYCFVNIVKAMLMIHFRQSQNTRQLCCVIKTIKVSITFGAITNVQQGKHRLTFLGFKLMSDYFKIILTALDQC